jgi:hypothetical protein
MPRNVTGGSGHKSQSNSEGSKARHNRCFVDDLLEDIRNNEKLDGVKIGRITKLVGSGRMEVFYLDEVVDDKKRDWFDNEEKKTEYRIVQQIIPMRGGLRGKGKKSVWISLDSLVMIADTGLSGTTHEIIAVFSPEQVARLRKLKPDMDERMFLKSGSTTVADSDLGFEFTDKDEVDVDNI